MRPGCTGPDSSLPGEGSADREFDMSVTFITGASSGIGRSLARRLAARGEVMALAARREDLLDSLAREIEDAGGKVVLIPLVPDRSTSNLVERIRNEES